MNTRKILVVALGASGVLFAIALAALWLSESFVKEEPAIPRELVSPYVVSQCEAALDEFTPEGNRPPQRVCKEEGGIVKVLASDKELGSEIKPRDTIVISINLAGILQRQWINRVTGEVVAKPSAQTRLCFVTYPVLMKSSMQGYPNFDQAAYDRFYENRKWSFSPAPVFDPALKGDNFVCSTPLLLAEFPEKVSFTIDIPTQDILALGPKGPGTRTYGVKIVVVPDRFLQGITMESFLANYQHFPPIYLFSKPIVVD